jgi:hypothetical protein
VRDIAAEKTMLYRISALRRLDEEREEMACRREQACGIVA